MFMLVVVTKVCGNLSNKDCPSQIVSIVPQPGGHAAWIVARVLPPPRGPWVLI